MAAVGVCNRRVLRGELTHAGTLVSSPVGPLGDLSEAHGEACDASQILSDRAENISCALHSELINA